MAIVTDTERTLTTSSVLEYFTPAPDDAGDTPTAAVVVPDPLVLTKGSDAPSIMQYVEKSGKLGKIITMDDAAFGQWLSMALTLRAAYRNPSVSLPNPSRAGETLSLRWIIDALWNKAAKSKLDAELAKTVLGRGK